MIHYIVGISDRLRPCLVLVALLACALGMSIGAASATADDTSKEPRHEAARVLLFEGDGAWQTEVLALKDILSSHDVNYDAMTTRELNRTGLEDLSRYATIVWPGGFGSQETESLSSETKANLRKAVMEKGVSWVGFCAGAFVAVNPAPAPGKDPEYGLSIVNDAMLKYYYLEDEFVKQGKEHEDWAMVAETFADGSKRDILWYGGPVTPDVPGGVVAKYPTGEPAISQLWSGKGFVIVSAGHPTVLADTIAAFGLHDTDGSDQEVAWRLIDAAMKRTPLTAF